MRMMRTRLVQAVANTTNGLEKKPTGIKSMMRSFKRSRRRDRKRAKISKIENIIML